MIAGKNPAKTAICLCSCALSLVAWATRASFATSSLAGRAPGLDASAHRWSHRFGDQRSQRVNDVAFDPDGNLAVAGTFIGTMDLGGGLLSGDSTDVFVAKYDARGNHIWSRRFGDAEVQSGSAVATDGEGGVVLAGHFNGVLDFGGAPLVSHGVDLYVARFDSSGNHLWSRSFGDSNQQFLLDVAIDAWGNVLIIGDLNGSVDFGGGPLSSTSAYDTDVFVAKFAANGTHLWSRRFGDSDPQYGYGIAADGWGNVVITGAIAGSVDFGGGALTSAGAQDLFVAKYDADGNHLWSRRFGDEDWQLGYAVAVDAAGNVAVNGSFSGSIDFGSGPLTSAGLDDVFLAKLDANGNSLWSRRFGDASTEDPFAVAVDTSGAISIVGNFQGEVDFGGGPLTSAGGWDIYVAQFDPCGTLIWSDRFGDSSTQYAVSIAADACGDVAVAGWFTGSVDFGSGPLTSAGSSDAFVARLADPTPTDALPTPARSLLRQNRPNPFNPTTVIEFELEHAGPVVLQVRDLMGRHVTTLVNRTLPAGGHVVRWDGTNQHGERVASGEYLYSITTGAFEQTRKLVVVK